MRALYVFGILFAAFLVLLFGYALMDRLWPPRRQGYWRSRRFHR